MKPAIFLDRDGVLIENRADYVKSSAEIGYLDNAFAAMQTISTWDVHIVIVTNQSAVGRGIISRTQADSLNQEVADTFRARGGRIDAVYLCPHHPKVGCACRKPQPGMLLAAAAEHHIDLGQSVMIGDALTDMDAAQAAGVRRLLVLTGRGRGQVAQRDVIDYPIVADLQTAVKQLTLQFNPSVK